MRLFYDVRAASSILQTTLEFLKARSLPSVDALVFDSFFELMRLVQSNLDKIGVRSTPRVKIEAVEGDGEMVKRIRKVLNEKGAVIVGEGEESDFTLVAHGGETARYERNSLRSVFPTEAGKMRVHRVGNPDSYDFDVLEKQAPPLRPLARGHRLSNQYIVDLENFNEWPTPSDYLLVCPSLEEADAEPMVEGEQKGKRSVLTVNRVRGDLSAMKRVKTEGEMVPNQAASLLTQVSGSRGEGGFFVVLNGFCFFPF